ncbi:uncharacterized protein F4807DRAFT_459619 [Annulohypoxylon truncatum]|uniref:uncharacterized protein n=1 Tax=Annulohypoxylon truncatum TaxID=327061 RepID=UPI002007F426|nr:uncharacterized protein F4807DRAFT_459619 [Annulohypoxylon truncatum]KAI1210780.1 hypothetical protein F4807DRAFT_459619 [Annulohypoxylon truncatum]
MASSQDQASASTAVEPYKQPFPPEVFIVLVENMPDYMLPYLWCKFRQVCKAWKAEVEKAFLEKYLAKTKVIIKPPYDRFESELHFSRVSKGDGEQRAFFKSEYLQPGYFMPVVKINSMVPQANPTLYRPFPGIVILVKMENVAISDPAMEGFMVDRQRKELSFLWKPMMNQLMGDELRFRREACKMIESAQSPAQKPEVKNTKPGPDTESDAKTPGDKTHTTKRKSESDEELQVKKINLGPEVKPEAKVTTLQHDAQFEASRKKVQLYMLLRSEKFRAVMNQVRESRLRKQYAACGDEFVSIEDHDGIPWDDDVTRVMSETRLRFRSPGFFLEF